MSVADDFIRRQATAKGRKFAEASLVVCAQMSGWFSLAFVERSQGIAQNRPYSGGVLLFDY
jgi:hypothetical protein